MSAQSTGSYTMANQPRHTANYLKNNRARLDKLVAANTAFKTFDALLNAQGNYFPSIRIDSFDGAMWLCDCYDSAQMHRKDSRRACRSFSNTPRRFTAMRVQRSDAGNLYNAVDQHGAECNRTPTHSEETARAIAAELNRAQA